MPEHRRLHPDAEWTELVATDADWDAADPELLRHVLLPDPVAGAENTAEDRAAQVVGDALGGDGHRAASALKNARPCGYETSSNCIPQGDRKYTHR